MSSPLKLRFEEILKLVEYIPITGSLPNNGRFPKNTTIDSMFYFESLQRKVEYLLFDFCLATLDEDYLDAALYLAHSFHILSLSKSFNLLLSVIVNEKLTYDKDVRRLIILLTRAMEPCNAESYIDMYGIRFRRRYEKYTERLRKEAI